VAGSNTLVLPSSNGSAHQLLKNSGTAGTLEYGVTLPSGNGTADQALVTDGSGTLSFADRGRMVLGTAQASTSGTNIDFTGIPSWVKKITVMFDGVSTNGASSLQIQLGDSGGFETSSYLGAESTAVGATNSVHSAGFIIKTGVAAGSAFHGVVVLQLLNASTNAWAESGNIATSNTTQVGVSGGSKALSATLDRVRLTTVNGTDTFDAGSLNLLLEG
jgi:hypothetical protein